MTPLRKAVAARVDEAVVRLPSVGLGVLVPGGLIVTAAHCIKWPAEGNMSLSDSSVEEIRTADGRSIKTRTLAVEPIGDLAVLGELDGQASPEFFEANNAYDDFCSATKPLELAIHELDVGEPFDAYVFTHDKGIIPVRIRQNAIVAEHLWFDADQRILGGTSGGPVVTPDGRLLGIVHTVGDSRRPGHQEGCVGTAARVHLVAPLWLVRKMVPPVIREKLNKVLPEGRLRLGD